MALTEKQQIYQKHLRAAEHSGQSLRVYAKSHGVSVQSLYSERQRMRRAERKTDGGFLKVQDVSTSPLIPMALLQVRLPNGVSLGIPTDQMALRDLLLTLAKL
ncbi:MAG: hypothetical protein ACFHX7_12320 [Pseudomonadota bacterium]